MTNKETSPQNDLIKQSQSSNDREPTASTTKEWMSGNFDDRTERSADHFDQQQEIEKRKEKLRKIREKQQQKNTPEKGFCSAYNIDMLWNMGGNKIQSSSDLIKKAKEFSP